MTIDSLDVLLFLFGTSQVVWYSHIFQNFPQFVVIHTVKGFGIVNKAEIDVFLELSCFFDDPADVGSRVLVGHSLFPPYVFSKSNALYTAIQPSFIYLSSSPTKDLPGT